jgi:dsDNA-specific endonuclease/ATPase MutS2
MSGAEEQGQEEEPVEFPIDGELDLHTFRPGEIGELIPDYLEACRQRGILRVRLVHGKGSGALRQGVHAVLKRLPGVESFRTGDAGEGGWGATVVFLRQTD